MSDSTLLDTLRTDPERGMTLLIEKYTGLIWHVVSYHVADLEDIRECVNDTFIRFYYNLEKFDLSRASLTAYLTVIARNTAVSRFRREKHHRVTPILTDLSCEDRSLTAAELRADMERALGMLGPGESQIIRMKYYDGMSVKEIADSLGLPYETVKKRHHRSILKLRTSLLLMLLLLALCSICAYGALRYFDLIPPVTEWIQWDREPEEDPEPAPVSGLRLPDTSGIPDADDISEAADVTLSEADREPAQADTSGDLPEEIEGYTVSPGYGINTVPGQTSYTLLDPVQIEKEDVILCLEKAVYSDGFFTTTVNVYTKSEPLTELAQEGSPDATLGFSSLSIEGECWSSSLITGERTKNEAYIIRNTCIFQDVVLPSGLTENTEYRLSNPVSGTEFTFHMTPVISEKLNSYPYQWKEYGGVLAMPRLENGSLIIAIYPLNDDSSYRILPGLIRGSFGQEEDGTVTVTKDDGTVLSGTCRGYSPRAPVTYYEWDFGKAEPGNYTLHIPYLYEEICAEEDFSISLKPAENTCDTSVHEFPGGKLWIESFTPIDADTVKTLMDGSRWFDSCPSLHYWLITMRYVNTDSARPVTDLFFHEEMNRLTAEPEDSVCTPGCSHPSQNTYIFPLDQAAGTVTLLLEASSTTMDLSSAEYIFREDPSINYRWDQNFDIPFTVE